MLREGWECKAQGVSCCPARWRFVVGRISPRRHQCQHQAEISAKNYGEAVLLLEVVRYKVCWNSSNHHHTMSTICCERDVLNPETQLHLQRRPRPRPRRRSATARKRFQNVPRSFHTGAIPHREYTPGSGVSSASEHTYISSSIQNHDISNRPSFQDPNSQLHPYLTYLLIPASFVP